MRFSAVSVLKSLDRRLKNRYVVCGIVAIVSLIAYCNSFTVPFLLDDFGSIQNNYSIHSLFDFRGIWEFYANRIVLYFTLSLNYAVHGNAVEGYHVVNLAIHILNGILFYTILEKIFDLPYFKGKFVNRFRNAVSVFAALIFVSHPIQVNAVTYIVQRTASLAALFYLLAINCFIDYRVRNKWHHLFFTFLSTVAAMFTKENTITIPFMLLLLECMFFVNDKKTTWKKRVLVFLLLFATVPIIPITNTWLQGHSQSDPNITFKASTQMDRLHYFYTQLNVILLYARLLFIPIGQNFDYSNDFPISTTIWDNYSYISFIILLLIGLFSLFAIKRNRLVSLGIMWFFIGLSVESSFISIKDVYFEHRLYFPCAGFIMFLTGMATYERKKIKGTASHRYIFRNPVLILSVLYLVLIPVYSGLTIYRNYIYSDSIRLWSDVVRKAPLSDRAHSSLATQYLNAYDEKKMNTEYLDLAEMEFKKALSINDSNNTAHTNLSKVYLLKGDYQNCIIEAKRALKIRNSEYAQFNLGSAYKKLGKTEEALEAFKKGYEYNNRSAFIIKALGDFYYETGDYVNAQKYYKEYFEKNRRLKNSEVSDRLKEIEEILKK